MFVQLVEPSADISHCQVTLVTRPSGSERVAVMESPVYRLRRRQGHRPVVIFNDRHGGHTFRAFARAVSVVIVCRGPQVIAHVCRGNRVGSASWHPICLPTPTPRPPTSPIAKSYWLFCRRGLLTSPLQYPRLPAASAIALPIPSSSASTVPDVFALALLPGSPSGLRVAGRRLQVVSHVVRIGPVAIRVRLLKCWSIPLPRSSDLAHCPALRLVSRARPGSVSVAVTRPPMLPRSWRQRYLSHLHPR